ncbi:Protein of unknown function, partial [Gryllus bimaculatus]
VYFYRSVVNRYNIVFVVRHTASFQLEPVRRRCHSRSRPRSWRPCRRPPRPPPRPAPTTTSACPPPSPPPPPVSGLCNFLEPVPFSVCFLVVSKVNFLKSVLWTKTGNGYWILHIEVELQLFEYETASCYYWMFWGMYKSCPVLLQIITQNYGMINILAVYFHRCVF